MEIIPDSLKYIIPADIIQESEEQDKNEEGLVTTIFTGIFQKGKDETSPDGCIIKKICITNRLGVKKTKIQFAEGLDNVFTCSWANKENYTYKYAGK
jgi:hypothetical protein